MSRTPLISALLPVTAMVVLASTQAHAVQRTFVASFGADTNTAVNCSLAAPCRGFAAAQTVTDNNGEIIVLDSAGYGAVTITKSISIIAPNGVYAGISVFPGADGVTIATPNVNVVLRGLTINGQGGNNGINMTAGSKLTVENCVISNLTENGINVNTFATVRVIDTIVRDNGSAGIYLRNGVNATITRVLLSGHVNNAASGIRVEGNVASTITIADIAESTVDRNGTGVLAASTIGTAVVRVSVRDSRAVRNLNNGLYVQGNTGSAATLSASNNMVANNGTGITAFFAGAKVWASGNTVSDNTNGGLQNSGGIFESAGNNAVRNNGANVGTITVVGTQ